MSMIFNGSVDNLPTKAMQLFLNSYWKSNNYLGWLKRLYLYNYTLCVVSEHLRILFI